MEQMTSIYLAHGVSVITYYSVVDSQELRGKDPASLRQNRRLAGVRHHFVSAGLVWVYVWSLTLLEVPVISRIVWFARCSENEGIILRKEGERLRRG